MPRRKKPPLKAVPTIQAATELAALNDNVKALMRRHDELLEEMRQLRSDIMEARARLADYRHREP